jgi:hypothetical protein
MATQFEYIKEEAEVFDLINAFNTNRQKPASFIKPLTKQNIHRLKGAKHQQKMMMKNKLSKVNKPDQ